MQPHRQRSFRLSLQRHQPMLPMGLGHAQGVNHGYVRHGTTTLFAALDLATGEVHAQCKRRHRHQDYLAFLRHIDENVPADLDVHLAVDNYATHKHAKVRAWLARRPRYHVHYTPTYASWPNQVQRWFGIITQQAIRRGTFSSVAQLRKRIEAFVENYNTNCRPFAWTATAESILDKVKRIWPTDSGDSTLAAHRRSCHTVARSFGGTMFLITNRVLHTSRSGLDVFGKSPNPKGPNELRIVEANEDGTEVRVLDELLDDGELDRLETRYGFAVDRNRDWYVSLRIACQLFDGARREGTPLLLYVHGYNNDMGDVLRSAQEIQERYRVLVIPFSWPANGGGPITGAASYLSDKDDARASTTALHRAVEKVRSYHRLLTEGTQRRLWQRAREDYPDDHDAPVLCLRRR